MSNWTSLSTTTVTIPSCSCIWHRWHHRSRSPNDPWLPSTPNATLPRRGWLLSVLLLIKWHGYNMCKQIDASRWPRDNGPVFGDLFNLDWDAIPRSWIWIPRAYHGVRLAWAPEMIDSLGSQEIDAILDQTEEPDTSIVQKRSSSASIARKAYQLVRGCGNQLWHQRWFIVTVHEWCTRIAAWYRTGKGSETGSWTGAILEIAFNPWNVGPTDNYGTEPL